ncbi:HTH-type transcriptional regulator MetR [Candidatus Methylobacter favarea]|uniref:HTH-type transcriptional regulator MetR n=1 Tax=Candidatus Methylobacter favarea TaxID=2707345 RepID=A0A8S0X1G0_9GAMM|nr:LysR family transcriptional regulator [Candidatus Methylobacter favarea]CAA9891208.1 HTH-type transcriptional regulator MetR [Candidatus Methylobacter favarea]
MLELRHLRSIRAIAETNKLGLAAERVFLTQSALSHQIRALETHYGITLFQRTAQGLRFTPAGQCFLDLANELLPAVEKTERDLIRLKSDQSGELRIVLECHTCFDWLTPVMDVFRRAWPEVELDLVAGFHSDPWSLIDAGKADLVIGSPPAAIRELASRPLFRFEIMAVLPPEHSLSNRRYLQARDFSEATLLTYPVPEARIDLIAKVLKPAGIAFERRTAELTVAIMQLVASRRGIAALPSWGIKSYVDHDYVIARRIGKKGLWSDLFAIGSKDCISRPYVQDFVKIIRDTCAEHLPDIKLL